MPLPLTLIVDDDPHFLRLAAAALAGLPHRVRTASDGGEALAVLRNEDVRLVVSDVRMPGVDGAALRAALRSDPRRRDVPLLFASSDREGAPRGAADKAQGADALRRRVRRLLAADAAAASRRSGGWSARAFRFRKRALSGPAQRLLDLVVGSAAAAFLLPLVVVAALAVRLGDGGPAFYVQTRVGRGGRRFAMYKLRTMRVDADRLRPLLAARSDDGDAVRFKMRRDPRITAVGAFLRRYSVDELPQLWNVLKGDMSLVGPRPPIPEETAKYSVDDWRRLDVKPGLTGPWQVGGRAEIPFPRQVRLDVRYGDARGLLGDLALLARTPRAVLGGRGAC